MKIAFFEIEDWEKEYLTKKIHDDEVSFFSEPLDQDFSENLAEIEAVSIFIYSKIDSKVLKKMPKLRFITTRSTGFDHIDLAACAEHKIAVANVPNYGENTVAEHAFALILALSRKIVPSVDKVRRGEFTVDGLRGFDLAGKTLGIAGTGRIGSQIAKIGYGFGMKLLGYDRAKNAKLSEYGLKYVDFNTLLAKSDIVTLNLRHTAETHHLINEETIGLFKPGAYLVNTARGGLIDTPVLLSALSNGTLAGVALDVLEDEGTVKEDMQILSKRFPKRSMMVSIANNILIRQPNVIITPHNAFNSKEAIERILETTVENFQSFENGSPINLVDARDN